jgi:hypothetical protein
MIDSAPEAEQSQQKGCTILPSRFRAGLPRYRLDFETAERANGQGTLALALVAELDAKCGLNKRLT